MTFTSLTTNAEGIVAAIVTLGFLAVTLALITNITAKKNKETVGALSFLLFLITVDLTALIEFIDFSSPSDRTVFSPLAEMINAIPYPIHIILGIVSVWISVYSIYKAYKADKDSISGFTIKEALESLPTGIAFVSEDNTIHLSNKIMHNLCKELAGKDLISGIDIWGELCRLRSSNKCVIDEKHPAFKLNDGKVWQFSKTAQGWHTGDYIEIKATDITELYGLREHTREFGDALTHRQERLKALTTIIESSTAEEIAVTMKVGFHDNFGNLITLTKEMLRETPENGEIGDIAGRFAVIGDIITDLTSDQNQDLSLEEIQKFGERLGCEVVISGELSVDGEHKNTILLCINEALKNAYTHGDADKITVTINETTENITVTIHNETKTPLSEISEGGGLTGLRQRVEHAGGSFRIMTYDGVTMEIKLNKDIARRNGNV